MAGAWVSGPPLPSFPVRGQGYFFLPEGAEGLIIVDVSRTESSNHGCSGVAPCQQRYTCIREKLIAMPAVTHHSVPAARPRAPTHVLTQVLPQQPGQH